MIFFKKLTCQRFDFKEINYNNIKEILLLGINALLQSAGLSVIIFIINNILSKEYDYTYITSFSYVSKIAQFALVALMSISTAISPIISFNYSANSPTRVKKAVNLSMIYSYACCFSELILLLIFSNKFIMIFTLNKTIIMQCNNIISILSFSLLFLPPILIISTYFQAIKNKKNSFIITSFLLLITSTLLLILKAKNIWISIPIGCFLTLMLSIYLYKKRLPD